MAYRKGLRSRKRGYRSKRYGKPQRSYYVSRGGIRL